MKLDMVNFTITQFRPLVQTHSVDYEKQKFKSLLDIQKGATSIPVYVLTSFLSPKQQCQSSEWKVFVQVHLTVFNCLGKPIPIHLTAGT